MNTNVTRIFDASILNEVCNHPKVRPWLGGDLEQPLDLTHIVNSPNNIVLCHDGFYAIYIQVQPGLYEVHTQASAVKPPQDTVASAQATLRWMFTQTNCIEVLTRVPDGNARARRLTASTGFKFDFRVTRGWQVSGNIEECDILSLPLAGWIATDPTLVESGEEFHRQVDEACKAAGVTRSEHPDDANHDRWAGAAFEMVKGGQVGKAVLSYNRWAAMGGYMPIAPVSLNPLIIHIGDMALRVHDNHLEVLKCQ